MSIEKNIEKENMLEKEQQLLGKKTESSNLLNNLIDNTKVNVNQCKICSKKDYLIKCSKCSSYYCKDCLKKITGINVNKLKEDEYLCPNCQIKFSNLICYICNNKYEKKNLVSYKVSQEQEKCLKNELLYKGLTIVEAGEEALLKIKNNNLFIKICNNCHSKYNEIIQRHLNKKVEKEKVKEEFQIQRNCNIIDELTKLISKEKGETNIFNITDNKTKENLSLSNMNNNESQNEFNHQKMIENNLFLRDISDNLNNINKIISSKNKIIIDKNKNEIINNQKIFSNNINNNLLLKSNIPERNFNPTLNINPNTQNPYDKNINSNNINQNLYLPNFYTTKSVTSLQNSHNINPIITNLNNNIPNSNINNNSKSFNDINAIFNTKDHININNNLKSADFESKLIQNNANNIALENNNSFIPFTSNLSQNNINNKPNNFLNYDLTHDNNLNNCATNLGSINEGLNHLICLGKQINLSNGQSNNINNKNNKEENLINSMNNNINNSNNSGIENEIKATLNKISKDLYSFDNNNIENILYIINNIELISGIFKNIINEEKIYNNSENNNNENTTFKKSIYNNSNNYYGLNDEIKYDQNKENINNSISNNKILSNSSKENNISNNNINNMITDKDIPNYNISNNIINNNISNNNISNDNDIINIENNISKQNLFLHDLKNGQNTTQNYKELIDYILAINSMLKQQLETMKKYIEIQKNFVSIIFQNIEIFFHNFSLKQNKAPLLQQNIVSQKNNNHLENLLNNTNNKLSQLNASQGPISIGNLNNLNNLQMINPVAITIPILPSSNFICEPQVFTLPQNLGNNTSGRRLNLFNTLGQQIRQDYPKIIPNVFNVTPHFPLYPPEQGMNVIGNPNIGQNIPQMPILNQMNSSLINNINTNLQFVNKDKNIENKNQIQNK